MIYPDSRFISANVYPVITSGDKQRVILDNSREQSGGFSFATTYMVKDGDTLENIAYKFYQDATKWWIIADANKDVITHPLFLTTGILLNIPM